MRRWGLVCLSCATLVAHASAQPAPAPAADTGVTASSGDEAEPAAPPQGIVYGAMPGGIHVPSVETLPKGVAEVSTIAGYGHRKSLLDYGMGMTEKLNRGIGDIAFAYGVLDVLSVGLSLDGRYDRHYGGIPSPDDGYVGDPHLIGRFAKAVGKNHFGAQLNIWVPGNKAPSVVFGATSLDFRGLATIAAGPTTVTVEGGFRLDNSAKSVTDVTKLSLPDRVSLGVSNYNAIVAGAMVGIPAGKAWINVEGSLEAYIGGPPSVVPMAPTNDGAQLQEGTLTLRGGASVGFHITDQWSAVGFFELAKVPGILNAQVAANTIPLIPYEPTYTFGAGLQARFGGPKHAGVGPIVEKDCHKHTPPDCPVVKVPLFAQISGTVVDEAGKPVVGAKVSLTLKNSKVDPKATDDKGSYVFDKVPIGTSADNVPTLEETGVEVHVDVDGKKPGKASITQVAQGDNVVPPIKLESILPPGQLKVLVRALSTGRPVTGATITVEPGDKKLESGADGIGAIDLAPGEYKITVTAGGFAKQELDVTIEPNGVAFKNIDLHK